MEGETELPFRVSLIGVLALVGVFTWGGVLFWGVLFWESLRASLEGFLDEIGVCFLTSVYIYSTGF